MNEEVLDPPAPTTSSGPKEVVPVAELVKLVLPVAFARISDSALDLVSDEKNLERFSQTIAQLSKMFNSPLYFRFQHAKDLSESSLVLVQETLDIWLAHLRAVLLSRALPSFSQNNSAFNSCSTIKLKKIIDQIQTLKFLLSSTNVNTRLALEALMAAI